MMTFVHRSTNIFYGTLTRLMVQLVKINCLSFEKEKEVIAFRYKIPNSGVIYHISEGAWTKEL
jgi:hypothetical protein